VALQHRGPPAEAAAQYAALRIWGDNQVGGGIGKAKGEETYRAANLDGGLLASITEQPDVPDQPLGTEIEFALNHGLTPLAPSPAHPGFTRVVRTITSRYKDAQGNPSYSILDTSKVEVLHYGADRLEAFAGNEWPNKNLVPDDPSGRLPEHEDSVCPSMIRAGLLIEMYRMQADGLCVNVKEHESELRVEISPDNESLALAYIPIKVIKGFHNFAGELADLG
jgi:phage tail sheath gpL-like